MTWRDRRKIFTPMSTEYWLSAIFGSKTYHGFVGEHSFSQWKRHVTKLIKAIGKFIDINVITADSLHKTGLTEQNSHYLEKIKATNNIDSLNILTIEYLSKTLLMLLGMLPDNFFRKAVNNKKHYQLNRHRQIVYVQDFQQKAYIILDLTQDQRYESEIPSYNKLSRQYYYTLKGNSQLFVSWFKQHYPTIYLQVF